MKSFKYRNGYVGNVSDAVAKILEDKGEGHVVEAKPATVKAPASKATATAPQGRE